MTLNLNLMNDVSDKKREREAALTALSCNQHKAQMRNDQRKQTCWDLFYHFSAIPFELSILFTDYISSFKFTYVYFSCFFFLLIFSSIFRHWINWNVSSIVTTTATKKKYQFLSINEAKRICDIYLNFAIHISDLIKSIHLYLIYERNLDKRNDSKLNVLLNKKKNNTEIHRLCV